MFWIEMVSPENFGDSCGIGGEVELPPQVGEVLGETWS